MSCCAIDEIFLAPQSASHIPKDVRANTATSSHDHWIKQNDHDLSKADYSDYVLNARPKVQRQYQPFPLAFPDDQSWPAELHPWISDEWHWPYEFEDLTS